MRDKILGLFAMAVLFTSAASSDITAADDKFVGAIWSMRLKNPKGEWAEVIKFRATTDGKIFHEGKQIGTHESKGTDDLAMTWDKKGPLLNGSYKLIRVKKDNGWWAGTLTRAADSKDVPVRLGIVGD